MHDARFTVCSYGPPGAFPTDCCINRGNSIPFSLFLDNPETNALPPPDPVYASGCLPNGFQDNHSYAIAEIISRWCLWMMVPLHISVCAGKLRFLLAQI